jgi:hypothetical protein
MFSRRPTARANRGRIGGAQLRAIWPPTQVSGNVGWWDLRETFTESGGAVTSIRNMVSGVDATEATAPPLYDATGLAGGPCMTGDGSVSSRKILTSEAAVVAAFSGAAKALTAVVVAQPTTGSGAAMSMMGAADSALIANSSWRIGLTGADALVISKRGTATVSAGGAGAIPAAANVFSYRTTGTTADIWRGLARDGNVSSFSDSGTPTPNRVGLMCYPVATISSFFNGKWGCGLLFTRALSDAELRGVILGLKVRWSI